MEKKDKTKILGILLILIGCLIIATAFVIIVDWIIVVLVICTGGGCYLVKIGYDYIEQSNQPVN